MTSWPHWLQVLCCYRPPEDEEDDFVEEPQFIQSMRQSYLEGGMSYSEASRAQAIALVREASAGSWRNRIRPRAMSPSDEDPVPPYPGPPLTPLQDPFSDPSISESAHSSEAPEGNKEEDKEAGRTRPDGSGYSQ